MAMGVGAYMLYKGMMSLAVLRDGDYFGELALLSNAPRNASVRTTTHCLMLTLPRNHFKKLLDEVPELKDCMLHRYQLEAIS